MATLTVGVGGGFDYTTLASAIAASHDGDVIKVQAGTYTNDFAAITTSITIEGVGGMVNLVATTTPLQEKGILIIGADGTTGPNVTLDNIAFSGAAIPDADGGNGAGIRYQSGNLTINNGYFHDNQDGLLADADPTGTITINNTEFAGNGNANPPSSGIEHNLYVGAIQQLTIDNSYFTDPIVGHDIKSRAANTTIENSRIFDPNGNGSYEIDLPNGGNAIIQNNTIEKGAGSQNSNFISFGEEGNLSSGSTLSVTGNTVINDDGGDANLVANNTAIPASVTGNTAYGLTGSQIATGPVATPESNTLQPLSSAPALDTSPPYLPVMAFSFACFAEGTCILTDAGSVPVEALRIGQQVATAGSGEPGFRTIRWIGYRHIDLVRHPDPASVRPVRIRADAFADGVPMRDLLVSPDHAIYADGLLIPARLLRNDTTIVREDRFRAIRYFHVELDRHDILLAEGLAAESYLDTGNRAVFENAGTVLALHPDLSGDDGQARREQASCAPFASDATRVEPVWRKLAARSAGLGYRLPIPATTRDPALRLVAGGHAYGPVARHGDCHVFVLPPATTVVRLLSRSAAPCEIEPWVEDRRPLGVAVGCVELTGRDGVSQIAVDDPSLTDGWWAPEREGDTLWRWTNGNAALSVPAGVAVLAIHLVGETTFKLVPGTAPPARARVA
jgi:hypothetical protein